MISKALFSSNSDEWTTPQHIFDNLDAEFNFNLDPCATENNHKCDAFYTAEIDGLKQNWGGSESFAIHLIAIFLHGLKRHLEKRETIILWLCC